MLDRARQAGQPPPEGQTAPVPPVPEPDVATAINIVAGLAAVAPNPNPILDPNPNNEVAAQQGGRAQPGGKGHGGTVQRGVKWQGGTAQPGGKGRGGTVQRGGKGRGGRALPRGGGLGEQAASSVEVEEEREERRGRQRAQRAERATRLGAEVRHRKGPESRGSDAESRESDRIASAHTRTASGRQLHAATGASCSYGCSRTRRMGAVALERCSALRDGARCSLALHAVCFENHQPHVASLLPDGVRLCSVCAPDYRGAGSLELAT